MAKYRLTRITTRTGDDGTTGLGAGQRVPKDALRVAAYGAIDELSSGLGVALAANLDAKLAALVREIQHDLFVAGADLCVLEADKEKLGGIRIEARHLAALDAAIEELNADLGPLENFILPGGTPAAAQLHVCRTVCRRAEREAVRLRHAETIGAFVIPYLNRLSDLLFVLARAENRRKGVAETQWKK